MTPSKLDTGLVPSALASARFERPPRMFRDWGHQFIYDPDALRETIEAAGFTDVTFCAVGESEDPAHQQLQRRRIIIQCPVAIRIE